MYRDPAKFDTHVIRNDGYPVTTWLEVTYADADTDEIVQIDTYADEACTKLLAQDDGGETYTPEQIDAINDVVYAKRNAQAAERVVNGLTKMARLAEVRRIEEKLRLERQNEELLRMARARVALTDPADTVPSILALQAG